MKITIDIVDRINDYESGKMTPDERRQFFCDLKNWGVLQSLQGSYHRTFIRLFQRGLIGEGNLDGQKYWVVAPTIDDLQNWENQSGCEAVGCSCWIESDGTCQHGNPSWLLYLGLI